jgi:hypothetical protein
MSQFIAEERNRDGSAHAVVDLPPPRVRANK